MGLPTTRLGLAAEMIAPASSSSGSSSSASRAPRTTRRAP
jgi:hypothetical protein